MLTQLVKSLSLFAADPATPQMLQIALVALFILALGVTMPRDEA